MSYSHEYFDHYYVELTNGKAYEVICYDGETSDGDNHFEMSLLALVDNYDLFADIKDVVPVYITKIMRLPSIPEWVVNQYLENEDSPYIEESNGFSLYWFREAEQLPIPTEWNEHCHQEYEYEQHTRMDFAEFVKKLGYKSPQEIEGQDEVCRKVLYKWYGYKEDIC